MAARWTPRADRAFGAMLAASLLVHAAAVRSLGAGRAPLPPLARSARLADRAPSLAGPVLLDAARRDLVARARADRAAGHLRLGEFLLEAGALDAREQGRAFDLPQARELWAERLARLQEHPSDDLRESLPDVLADLHYYGRPGRSMGDALLEGGGACEPLTHLVVAAVHDLGQPERARLRYYGGGSDDGATHVAPVYADARGETDLLTGNPSQRSGALIAGADLVDAYARAHGIDPSLAPGRGGSGSGAEESRAASSSLVDGYPPNADHYPGTVPLYAAHALHAPGTPAAPATLAPSAQPADCAYFVRKAVLDPPSLMVSPDTGSFSVELRKLPHPAQLDRTFAMAHAVERSLDPADPAEHLVALACLTALYDAAAVDLSLSSQPELSRLTLDKRRKAAGEGERILAGIDWEAPAGRALLARLAERFAGRSWLLLVLPGGDAPVLRLAGEAGRDGWGRTDALAALLVAPSTRPAALERMAALPRRAQVEVMHEVFHAHDHQRPWASSYALEGGEGEVVRAYRVFRSLSWGLWEAARPQDEILAGVLRGAAAERLDRGWVSSFLEYYGRNALAIHQLRPDGRAVARALARWLEDRGFTDLDVYPTALAAARDPT